MKVMPTKDPDATKDYWIDWSDWLKTDTIVTSTWLVPPGLTAVSDSFTTTLATIWVTGGQAGQRYVLTNRITTAAGRTEDRSMEIPVGET